MLLPIGGRAKTTTTQSKQHQCFPNTKTIFFLVGTKLVIKKNIGSVDKISSMVDRQIKIFAVIGVFIKTTNVFIHKMIVYIVQMILNVGDMNNGVDTGVRIPLFLINRVFLFLLVYHSLFLHSRTQTHT